jgi:cytochrome c
MLLARVHPFGDAGLRTPRTAQPSIMERAPVPLEVRDLLIAKCADCHSAQTHVPIYGRFAPIAWLMERDIIQGRRRMNLSEWDAYSEDQRETLKAKIVEEAKAHKMPLPQYRIIHWNSGLSSAEIQALAQWARDPVNSSETGSGTTATSAGDPARGEDVFSKRCTGCHALTENREGPRLQGIYGRTTGAVAGFPYSDALRSAHILWNDETLEQWLADPDAFLPGNNMDFHVARPQERKDLIAYFKQAASN